MPLSVVTFHVLQYARGHRWSGFRMFAVFQQKIRKIAGLTFGKAMGCGRGAVFSVKPDWSRYAYLFEWESAEAARIFFASADWQRLQGGVEQAKHWRLKPIHSKGLWDGKPRFKELQEAGVPETPFQLAVITRADLKPWRLRSFGAAARRATAALDRYAGVVYTLGMGELPFVRQATFSVWDSDTVMKAYAYKDADHKAAMKGKKTHGWYGEELYARFTVEAYSEVAARKII